MAKKISVSKSAKKAQTKKSTTKKIVNKSSKSKPAAKTIKKSATKGKKKDDLMCFLTSACVHFYSLPDNCRELNTLRLYRDNYLLTRKSGVELVKEYYEVSPKIVTAINKDKNRGESYQYIYAEINKACSAIDLGKNERAKIIYTRMVNALQIKYLV